MEKIIRDIRCGNQPDELYSISFFLEECNVNSWSMGADMQD